MSLKDKIKSFYQERLKTAISKDSKEEINFYEQLLRQYSSYDIHSKGTGIFSTSFLSNLKSTFLSLWSGFKYPDSAIVSMFLYGSWLRGTNSPNSNLNVCIVYVRFDSFGKRIVNDSEYSAKDSVSKQTIKTRFKEQDQIVELNGQKVKLDFHFKELTSSSLDDLHIGPKIFL